MNLKKEIKISDLVRRPAKAKEPGTRTFPAAASRPRRLALPGRSRREVVGLKVGASQIAAARVVNNGGPKLLQLAREPVPPGIVGGGEVRSIPALGSVLDEFFTKHELPRRSVRLGVATNRIGVRAFDLAGIQDDRQLANAIRFRAHEAISIPIDEAVLDYHVVQETVDDAGAVNRRIVLTAAYRESIDHFVAACKAARIDLLGIDLEAFALLRAVGAPTRAERQRAALIAVTVGHDRTTVAISDGDVCEFTRVLEWGGGVLTSALARALRVTTAEAEQIKLQLALDDPDADDERAVTAREIVKRELQGLARELVATLHFYQSQPDSLAIGDVVVAGGTTRMHGLIDELARVTRVGVKPADPLARVAVSGGVADRDDLPSLAVAIGLGVEG
jgi:type IV pilus assembly protein PilM